MDRGEVLSRIQEIGILPAVRVCSSKDARFAAEAINRSGISIAEITMTVPGAIEVISHLARSFPDMVVGAGTVLDTDTAQRCLDAGARFLTSPGLVMDVVEFAVKRGVAVRPPWRLNPNRGDRRVESRRRFREDLSVRADGWSGLHQSAESSSAADSADSHRRCQSGNSWKFHSCRSFRSGNRGRVDAAGSNPARAGRLDP
jgi:hypothetical protein